MKKRLVQSSLAAALALFILLSAGPVRAQVPPSPQTLEPEQVGPIQDLADLLNYPYDVHFEDLTGAEKDTTVGKLMEQPEAVQLRMAMAEKGFFVDRANAEAMRVTLTSPDGTIHTLEVAIVPMSPGLQVFLPLILKNYSGGTTLLRPVEPSDGIRQAPAPEELSAHLVAMVADDGTTFFQAHHTNLDPRLAEAPDPPIMVNGMPYFYIATLQIIDGRIVFWHYWWFDSNHHPNWYYAYYQHYWTFYSQFGVPWPWWHHWAYGWYYWRFWYYWSTYFPWVMPVAGQ